MHSRILSLVMATGALLASPGVAPAADSNEATKSVHADRGTPRLQLFSPGPAQARSMAPATDEGESAQKLPQHLKAAWRFLSEHAADYGLTPDLSNLDLVETRQTLLGTTFRFKQLLGGQRVADGEIVVSVNDAGQVQQVYNNIYPVPANKAVRAATAQVGRDKAEQVAWGRLGAQGLLGEPMAELKYVPTASGDFVLAYDVRLYVERKTTDGEKRSGLWQVLVDAVDGEVIGQPSELTVNEGKRAGDQAYVGQAADFGAVVGAFRARRSERAAAMESRAEGEHLRQGVLGVRSWIPSRRSRTPRSWTGPPRRRSTRPMSRSSCPTSRSATAPSSSRVLG